MYTKEKKTLINLLLRQLDLSEYAATVPPPEHEVNLFCWKYYTWEGKLWQKITPTPQINKQIQAGLSYYEFQTWLQFAFSECSILFLNVMG